MRERRWQSVAIAFVLTGFCWSAGAQVDQFLPEVDFYSKVRDRMRFQLQAYQTREANEPAQAAFGPSVDFYTHPLPHLADVAKFDLDDTKSRVFVLSLGYRYLPEANGGAATNRAQPFATFRFPFTSKLLLSDRNRFDLDWKKVTFNWQYRNRFQVEGPIRIGQYHIRPYASSEAFYQSEYAKWSDTAIYIGALLSIGKHVQLDPYYEHQNETGKKPNERLNQFGLVLSLYF